MMPRSLLVPNTGHLAAPAVQRSSPTVGVVRAPWEPTPFEPTATQAVFSHAQALPQIQPQPLPRIQPAQAQAQPVSIQPTQQIKRMVMSADTSNQLIAARLNDLSDQVDVLTRQVAIPLTKTFNELRSTIKHETARQEQDRVRFEAEQRKRDKATTKKEITMAIVIAAGTTAVTMGVQLLLGGLFKRRNAPPAPLANARPQAHPGQ